MRADGFLYVIVSIFFNQSIAFPNDGGLVIPRVATGKQRSITIEDMAALRRVSKLEVSPDKRRFLIFIYQGDAIANKYRGGWFSGNTTGGALVLIDGGDLQLEDSTAADGAFDVPEARWSPDGQWIAYTLRHSGEVQIWRSRADGSMREQLTHHPADVREFSWRDDGKALYFTTADVSRDELRAHEENRERNGYQYDEDLHSYADFMLPKHGAHFANTDQSGWVVTLHPHQERRWEASEGDAFVRTHQRHDVEPTAENDRLKYAALPRVHRADGAETWLQRLQRMGQFGEHLQVMADLSPARPKPIACSARQCSGLIKQVWWSDDGKQVVFWRRREFGLERSVAAGFYAWSPSSDVVSTILPTDDYFTLCRQIAGNRLVCVRETKTRPPHLATIDVQSGTVQVVADVNPEFQNIRLGGAERFEWKTPKFSWNAPGTPLQDVYAARAYGYILYPPDFDPARKYPVIVEPYIARGFENEAQFEYPLHVYAAMGFVVLNTAFPTFADSHGRWSGVSDTMKELYSAELGFPHMTMFMESTVRALDVVAARGFIDECRVGIGGLSHGAFISLYMMQKYDRIAAISISGGSWSGQNYYWNTRKLGERNSWMPKPEGKGQDFWRQIDIADHIETIEAPILMNLAAYEATQVARLLRYLADAGKPYDAYVFSNETHIKWQPAHLYAIKSRNLDWFRFWLQGYEDPSPIKAVQYSRWRALKVQQESMIREQAE